MIGQPEPMSPLEAVRVLYAMADECRTNGADHRAKDEAAQVLKALLAPEPES